MSIKDYALQFVGKPYLWGCKSLIQGADCSGFVCEMLKAQGLIKPHEQFGSQQIYDMFYVKGKLNVRNEGALAFYGTSDKGIDHVALMIDDRFIIEAAGGDHTTLTVDDAVKREAMVRIRPINYRQDFVATLFPNF